MLKEYIWKIWSNIYLFLFQYNNLSVKRKLNVKSFGEKCQALKDLEIGISEKEVAKKYGVPWPTIGHGCTLKLHFNVN